MTERWYWSDELVVSKPFCGNFVHYSLVKNQDFVNIVWQSDLTGLAFHKMSDLPKTYVDPNGPPDCACTPA